MEHDRQGHEFYSCQLRLSNALGFSRWGNHGSPQGLKPSGTCVFFGTSKTRALPSSDLSGRRNDSGKARHTNA